MSASPIPVGQFRDGTTTTVDLSRNGYSDDDAVVIASLLQVRSVAEAHLTVLSAVTMGLDNRHVWLCVAECKLQSD